MEENKFEEYMRNDIELTHKLIEEMKEYEIINLDDYDCVNIDLKNQRFVVRLNNKIQYPIIKQKVNDYSIYDYKFKELYIINSGKKFENIDYNYIIIVGLTLDNEYILITNYSDVYEIKDMNDYGLSRYGTDIPRNLGCIRHFVRSSSLYFKITSCLSSCDFEVVKNDKE